MPCIQLMSYRKLHWGLILDHAHRRYSEAAYSLEYIVCSWPMSRMAVNKILVKDGCFKRGVFSRKVHLHHGRDRLPRPCSSGEAPIRDGLPATDAACQGGWRVSARQSAQSLNDSRDSPGQNEITIDIFFDLAATCSISIATLWLQPSTNSSSKAKKSKS